MVSAAVALGALPTAASARQGAGAFKITNNSYTFGQAPAFLPDGRVVFNEDFGKGAGEQLYVARRDGTRITCITCGQAGPNMVPQTRPQGDWILYHSWAGRHVTVGAPGFGGLGSSLFVVRPDGSHATALTGTDAAHGAGEGEDDYHAYWSPDGRHVVWTHLNWNFVDDGGNGKWDVRVADFVDDGSGPHLTNVRVVRPANGHWYETQWWAPDGSGFLYTETYGSAMNTELFYCRLTPSGCSVRRLTDNAGWDEQAIFTPDMKNVIFMSTRDHPGLYNSFSALAQAAGLPTDADYLITLPIFEAGFLQPVAGESTDLYELNLHSKSLKRLSTDGNDGWITPEFTWDPHRKYLFWTELRFPDGMRTSLPPDPGQAQKLAGFLQHPPLPGGTLGDKGSPGWYLQERTRIGRFTSTKRPGKR